MKGLTIIIRDCKVTIFLTTEDLVDKEAKKTRGRYKKKTKPEPVVITEKINNDE